MNMFGGGGDSQTTMKWIFLGVGFMLFASVLFPLLLIDPSEGEKGEYQDEIDNVNEIFKSITGSYSTPEQNIWTMTGCYTPYDGSNYGYTPDGWLYGTKITTLQPEQYNMDNDTPMTGRYAGKLEVVQASNGLWYYKEIPKNDSEPLFQNVVLAKINEDGSIDTKGQTVYSTVHFDRAHKSDIFFTPSSKKTDGDQYYYAYNGYRYVYQPLSSYTMNVNGEYVKVDRNSTSLSLIWYQYATSTGGIQGQLAISGSDQGVSYITAQDIIREFNDTNLCSTFDMIFNSCTMHLVIRLDPLAYSIDGGDVESVYNDGYFSVLVYSDAIAESVISSQSYEFSIENVGETLIGILTFKLDEKYDIDGWMQVVVSLLLTLPLYLALISLAFNNPQIWILLQIMALIQVIGSLWPF